MRVNRVVDHLKKNVIWVVIALAVTSLVLFYYWLQWADLVRFSLALDHTPDFMQDFVLYYHPMSVQVLQAPIRVSGYLYSLFFAIVLTPLGLLPLQSAMVVWFGLEVALLLVTIASARYLLDLSPSVVLLLFFLTLTAFPVLHNIKWGQVSILLTACMTTAFALYRSKRSILAGTLLAFAAAIKYYPGIALVYFILKRDIRASLTFITAFAVFYFILPVSVFGLSQWTQFERLILSYVDFGPITYSFSSQYFADVGFRWYMIFFGSEPSLAFLQALGYLGAGIASGCVFLTWKITQKALPQHHGLSLSALFITIPFWVRTCWPHYLVYMPLCQVALLSYFASRFQFSSLPEKLLIFLPFLSMLLSSVFFFLQFRNWVAYNGYGFLFFANLLLLICLLFALRIQPSHSAQTS